MKKRLLGLLLISLFSLPVLTGCNAPSNSGGDGDDMFDPDEPEPEDSGYVFDNDTATDYPIDSTIKNNNGSSGYEIFVRSFYDSNNDGIGDLKGVEQKLDYIQNLGVSTIWLMPIHPSPTYHGYDVTDYYAINQDYGSLSDFDSLVTAARAKNIDIMLDMVFNHSSTRHPWFKQSLEAYVTESGDKADWYCWGQGSYTTSYYGYEVKYSGYDSSMPDFNLDSSSLRAEIENIVKFWIQHGVKAFRLDAVKHYYEGNVQKNVEFLTWLEETAHKYDPNFYMVGEDWESNSYVTQYYDSKCDSFFKFSSSYEGSGSEGLVGLVKGTNNGNSFGQAIESYEKTIKEKNPNGYTSYFLSNHDMDRISASVGEAYAPLAANILATLPGMAYLYYGEEILLKGSRQPSDMSDARRRLPMIWDKDNKTGECAFPESNRQDLANNEQVVNGVKQHLETPFSVLKAYQRAFNIRNKYHIFKNGVFKNLYDQLGTTSKNVVAYRITCGDESLIFIHNCGMYPIEVNPIGTTIVEELNSMKKKPGIDANNKLHIFGLSSVILRG